MTSILPRPLKNYIVRLTHHIDSIKEVAIYFLIVGAILWLATYLMYAFFGVVASKVGFYYWREYLRAILRQDASWYESFDILELPSKISKEVLEIEGASGEKIASLFSAMVMTIGGLAVAFIIGWKFAFVCLGIIPFIMLGMVVMGVGISSKGKSKNYDKAGAYAE